VAILTDKQTWSLTLDIDGLLMHHHDRSVVFSTNKTDHHDIAEIVLSGVKRHQTNKQTWNQRCDVKSRDMSIKWIKAEKLKQTANND
jgi:hypothetical protein